MTAHQKCIAKWQKKLDKLIKAQEKWGKYINYKGEITIVTEILKDLKRLTK